jgi:hypothetical protein
MRDRPISLAPTLPAPAPAAGDAAAAPEPRPFWLRPEIDWPSLRPRAGRPGGSRAASGPRRRAVGPRCSSPGLGPEGCRRALCRRHGRCRPPALGPRDLLAGPPQGLGALILHLADSGRADPAAPESARGRLWLDLGLHLRALMRPALFDDTAAFERARVAEESGNASSLPAPPPGEGGIRVAAGGPMRR